MKPVLKSCGICTDHNNFICIKDILLVLTSVFLFAFSVVAFIKIVLSNCCQKYEYKYDCGYHNKHDSDCDCGCSDKENNCCCDCE